MKTQNQVLKNSVFNSLTAISAASKIAAKGWDKKATTIPVELYFEVIKAAKWKLHPTDKAINYRVNNVNKMMDFLFKGAKDSAFKSGVQSVSLDYIDITIKQVKEAFLKGMK